MDSLNLSPSEKGNRMRSPSYPCIGLPEAVSLTRRIYEKTQMHPSVQDDLSILLGYEGGSGWLAQRMSALSKFGLLEIIPASPTRGKACVLTALGEVLALWQTTSDEYKTALRQAALRPPIYDDLWNRFGPDLPPNSEMAAYLVDERKFNRNAVSSLLADFRATMDLADLKAITKPKPTFAPQTFSTLSGKSVKGVRHFRTVPDTVTPGIYYGRTASDLRRSWDNMTTAPRDDRTTAVPLADGETATITMPKKMSPQSWQMLLDTLELWKKQAGEG
jgi:hypothetical protein